MTSTRQPRSLNRCASYSIVRVWSYIHVHTYVGIVIFQSGSLIEDDMRNKLGPLLIKAGQLLAPNHFTLAMEGSPNGITSNQSNCKQSLSNPKDFAMTSKTVPLESLDPELADSLSQKANKLEKYKIISLHAQCHAARYLEGDEMEKR